MTSDSLSFIRTGTHLDVRLQELVGNFIGYAHTIAPWKFTSFSEFAYDFSKRLQEIAQKYLDQHEAETLADFIIKAYDEEEMLGIFHLQATASSVCGIILSASIGNEIILDTDQLVTLSCTGTFPLISSHTPTNGL